METLVPAAQTPALLAILTVVAAAALWIEGRCALGRKLTGFMVALLAGMALANGRVIPSEAPALDLVWTWCVPLALPLLLLQADLVRIFRETGPMLAAFLVGAAGSTLGGLIAAQVVPLGPETWKAAGVFVGTYIGGAINFVTIAKATDLSGDTASAAVAADNLVMALYFLVLIWAARSPRLRAWFTRGRRATEPGTVATGPAVRPAANVASVSAALAIAFGAYAAGAGIAGALGVPHLSVLFITAIAVALATLFPRHVGSLGGGEEIGIFLMHVFFAALGAAANVQTIVQRGPLLFAMATIVIATHMIVLFGVCRILHLPFEESIVASNANVGGPTTASAFAVGVRWNRLVLPAILTGILGYVVATYVGLAVAYAVR